VAVLEAAKRVLFGRALRGEGENTRKLSKRVALPVFASDALSSNAYATQEILIVLALGGVGLYAYGPWVAAGVVLVFAVVIASYRQNVREYPSGGGDYEVVSRNLGPRWGVSAGAALLIDYALTVAVSVSAAIANLGSVFPVINERPVMWAVGVIIAVTLLNLRGWGRSGWWLAIPSYAFILAIALVAVTAGIRVLSGDTPQAESAGWQISGDESLTGIVLLFLVARAFSSGTTALTGIETVTNGVPQFREPAGKNAATTLLIAGVISMAMFIGITWLALLTEVRVTENDADLIGLPEGQTQKTVIVQITEAVFSSNAGIVIAVAVATALILTVAANTSFNGFPILGSVLSRDGYLPRQLHKRGDRLAFSNGIVVLAAAAVVLVVGFAADLNSLIQLYILGVFVSFTLTQLGMVRHWTAVLRRDADPSRLRRARYGRIINLVGFLLTGSVLLIVLVTKFTRGAWIVVVALAVLIVIMLAIKRHYELVRTELAVGDEETMTLPSRVHGIVLVSRIHRPTLRALAYARATRPDVLEAITVNVDSIETSELERDWDRREIPVTLRILESPYRGISRPVVDYVQRLRRESPRDLVTIYIPEYVVGHWWERILHNQSALRLRARLLLTPGVMIVSVPWQLASSDLVVGRLDSEES
jgi:amino acid transporter